MDTETDTQGGIQMILGAAEMLEQRGDESLTQKRFSEGDTESEGEEELAGDVGEPCSDSSDGDEHTSEHQPLEEQSSVGWWREAQPWPQRQRSLRGDREPTDLKREKAVALHNKKEQIRRKELREAIHRLRNQLNRRTKKPSTISVLKAAQYEIRELKCQEAEGQQELDALTKKKNYLTWRLEKLVSEYTENRLRPPQVQPAIPGSFLHSNSSSRLPGDSHMMLPHIPNHPATSTGGTVPSVAAFPPRYLPVPTPPMLPTGPFHFPNSTIPSPPLLGFPPQFFVPSPTLQPPFMIPGSYFCAPGRFGHPSSSSNRILPTNSMFDLPPAPMPMLCPQLPILQQHQNMVGSRSQDGYHGRNTQKDKEYVPGHHSQSHSPRTRHCLSNSSRQYNHTAGSTDISSTYSDSNSCTSEEDCATREEEEIVDVEQDGPEVDGTRLPTQAASHHHLNSPQVGQRNHHSLETQRAIRNDPGLVQRLSSDDGEEPRFIPAQKNLPDSAASKRRRADTSPASPCGNKHSKFPKNCPKNLQDPPQLLRRVKKKRSISGLSSNIHVPSNLPKNLPGPPLLKRSQAETDNAVLVSRVMENIRPQREHISKKVSECALEKFSKFDLNLCNGELGHQLDPQQKTCNTDCDSLCKEKPNKKNGQIVRVSTEQGQQGQQVACSVY